MRPPIAGAVIPAHDEERGIARSLSLLGPGFDVVVVASACTDATADVARVAESLRAMVPSWT